MSSDTPARFPLPASFHGYRQFELFTDYGGVAGLNIVNGDDEIHVHAQKMHYGARTKLVASQPSLPVMPPNCVTDDKVDRCAGRQVAERTYFQHAVERIRRTRGKVKFDEHLRTATEHFLAYVERIEGGTSELPQPKLPLRDLHRLAEHLREKIGAKTDLPTVNSAYVGGSVSYVAPPGGDRGIVVYPMGEHMNELAIADVQWLDTRLAWPERPHTVVLRGTIYQLDTQRTGHGQTYCAVRHAEECCLLRLPPEGDTNYGSSVIETRPWADDPPTSINLSPYLPGECVVATKAGSVCLWSAGQQPRVVCRGLSPRCAAIESVWTCHYGSHPRQLVVSDRTCVALYDTRQARAAVRDLFALPSSLLHRKERLMVTHALDGRHFYHLAATDRHLLLLDERFPNYPVLQWRHLLGSPPQYMSTVTGVTADGDDVVVLASQTSRDALCFQLRVADPSRPPTDPPRPPQSTAAPWRVSQTNDFLHFAAAESIVDDMCCHLPRLTVSLCGVCAIRPPTGDGFTAVQLTAHGDVFAQSYAPSDLRDAETTWSAGPGCHRVTLTPHSRDVSAAWLRAANSGRKLLPIDEPAQYDASSLLSLISQRTYPHVACPVCWRTSSVPTAQASGTPETQVSGDVDTDVIHDDDDDDDDDVMSVVSDTFSVDTEPGLRYCFNCSMNLDYGGRLKEAIVRKTVLPSIPGSSFSLDGCLQGIDAAEHTDLQSQVILKIWRGEADVDDLLMKMQEEKLARQPNAVESDADDQSELSAVEEENDSADGPVVSPGGAAISPGGATVSQDGATDSPGDAAISPGGTTVSPGGAAVSPGGAAVSPGGAAVSPGGAAVSPGGAAVSPGGATVSLGGATVSPGGAAVSPGGASVSPEFAACVPLTPTHDAPSTPPLFVTPRRPRRLSEASQSSGRSSVKGSPGFGPLPRRVRASPARSVSPQMPYQLLPLFRRYKLDTNSTPPSGAKKKKRKIVMGF